VTEQAITVVGVSVRGKPDLAIGSRKRVHTMR
jgi:hypothetical protein